ncbi:site-2 protease family protein [Haploplasma axanthum]|uniref:Peptidase family M50 n=1 Tax=Haploplasma axanthum TaxID=29552 RepID=A0A449BDG8_HAPAX|nr:site-2 protease family protein [Haploplasma axanthum]VEU80472.1 Peptidase family M50 [Haploplasma axanthum]
MKKLKTIFIVIITAAITGFMMSVLKHNGLWFKIISGFKSIPIYGYILLIPAFVFIAILIHELGHLISFVLNGIKIRALYVVVFVIKKDFNNKWKFEIHPKNIKLFGGLVVPNLSPIHNDQKYEETKIKFSKALIAGPNTSIGYLIFSVISFLTLWFFTNSYFWIGFLNLNLIVTALMTILIIVSSKLNTDELYGDYVAHEKFLKDDTFVLTQIIQYRGFSLIEPDQDDEYLYSKIEKHYLNKYPGYNIFDISLVSNYLNMYDFSNEENILDVIKKYNVSYLASSKHGLELAYEIAAFYYKIKDVAKAYELFKIVSDTNNTYVEKLKKDFLNKQYEHLLNIKDNINYLESNKEVIYTDIELLLPIINKEKMFEEVIETLPFAQYSCTVEFKEETEI